MAVLEDSIGSLMDYTPSTFTFTFSIANLFASCNLQLTDSIATRDEAGDTIFRKLSDFVSGRPSVDVQLLHDEYFAIMPVSIKTVCAATWSITSHPSGSMKIDASPIPGMVQFHLERF